MGRIEKGFSEGADALLADELFALLRSEAGKDQRSRDDAIACYLSGSEGWRDAVKKLGGAFAEERTGLRERKAD